MPETASAAISASGTLLKIGDGTTIGATGPPGFLDSFVAIAEQKHISGPSMTRNVIDVSTQLSTWKQKITGLKDAGSISVDLNLVIGEATQGVATGLLGDFDSGVRRNFCLVFPDADGTTWYFPGVVKTFTPDAPVDGVLAVKVDIEISGAPVLDYAGA